MFTNPKILIINADDYGLDVLVNEAIRELFCERKISQTTLLINTPEIASEIECLLTVASPKQIGLHFNITYGQSLGTHYRTLTDSNRRFFPKDQCYALLENNKIDQNEIREECFLQIEALKRFLPSLAHLDSHHHIHLFPNVFESIVSVLKEQQIKTIRLPLENTFEPNVYAQKAKQILENIRSYGLRTCSHFFGLNLVGNPSLEEIKPLRKLFAQPSPVAVEWMVHPGKMGSTFYGSSRLPPEARDREFMFLKSEQLMQHLPETQYPRGTYHDLL